MKVKVAVEASVSLDRKRCGRCSWWVWRSSFEQDFCDLFGWPISKDSRGRPLRCRKCIVREVKP
ncbi:MAG: hypothetical protein WC683_01845 [bacterium]